ncbi:MAG: hypothetical protein ACRDWA_10730 [Acidimicrobiia bacterium]
MQLTPGPQYLTSPQKERWDVADATYQSVGNGRGGTTRTTTIA